MKRSTREQNGCVQNKIMDVLISVHAATDWTGKGQAVSLLTHLSELSLDLC